MDNNVRKIDKSISVSVINKEYRPINPVNSLLCIFTLHIQQNKGECSSHPICEVNIKHHSVSALQFFFVQVSKLIPLSPGVLFRRKENTERYHSNFFCSCFYCFISSIPFKEQLRLCCGCLIILKNQQNAKDKRSKTYTSTPILEQCHECYPITMEQNSTRQE